jgi:acetyltransferase-like isoleucine patch superfamily enzyme
MQSKAIYLFKGLKFLTSKISLTYSYIICYIIFYLNGVKFKSFKTSGIPYVHRSLKAQISIGYKFKMNNGSYYSDSGLNGMCRIEVRDKANLTIGDNVGMSDCTITCHENIIIGDNVLLGVGVQIRDTDNHSLNPQDRLNGLDWINKKNAPIIIKKNVFIGANSIILKGVMIGENSIVGAGSIVTKNIPNDEIWAGNPAKFIKKIYIE